MFLFLPFRIDRTLRSVPYVTLGLIIANVLVYLGTIPVQEAAWGVLGFRADLAGLVTWFTSMWLHGDILHLGGNMYFLWLFGSVVEDAIGRGRFILLYLLGGLAAALTHGLVTAVFASQQVLIPMIGASGAVAAVLGVFAVRMRHHNVRIAYFVWIVWIIRWGTVALTSVSAIVLWGLNEVVGGVFGLYGPGGGVASWAHVGGLAFGVVASLVFRLGAEAGTEALRSEADQYAAAGVAGVAAARYAKLAEQAPEDADVLLAKARAETLDARGVGATRAPWEEPPSGPLDRTTADAARAIELMLRAGRREDALAAVRELTAEPYALPLPASTMLQAGSIAEGRRDLAYAATVYGDIIRSAAPDSPETEKAWFRLAHVYLQAGRSADAETAWGVFRRHYPDSAWRRHADPELTALG